MVACLNHNRPLRRGFSLIEAAIVLGVVGLVVGAIWYAAANFYEDYKVNKTVEGIFTTARNTQKLISVRDVNSIVPVGGLVTITNLLINSQAFPSDWISGTSVNNPYGGTTNVRIAVDASADRERFSIYLTLIPQKSCTSLLTRMTSIGRDVIGGAPQLSDALRRNLISHVHVNYPHFYTTNFPVSLQTAIAACNSVTNSLEFGFGLTRIN